MVYVVVPNKPVCSEFLSFFRLPLVPRSVAIANPEQLARLQDLWRALICGPPIEASEPEPPNRGQGKGFNCYMLLSRWQ